MSLQKVSSEMVLGRISDSIAKCEKNPTTKTFLGFTKEQGMTNQYDLGVQAGILSNFNRVIGEYSTRVSDSMTPAQLEAGVTSIKNVGPYVPEIWPIIIAWYPDFPLRELISVQSMDQALAYLLYSELKTGTDKAPTIAGQVVSTPMGKRVLNGFYTTGEILGESIPKEQIVYDATDKALVAALAYAPLLTDSESLTKILVKVTTTAEAVYVAQGVVNGLIQLALQATPTVPVTGATIDPVTGAVSIPAATAPANYSMNVSYVWDIDLATDENIPKIVEDISMVPIEAKPRALQMQWTVFAEAVKRAQFGTDFRTENTKRVLNTIYQIQTRYVLDTMWNFGTGVPAEANIVIKSTNQYSLDVQAAALMRSLKANANVIEINSGRMEGNRIVCGRNLKVFLESLKDNWFKPTAQPAGFSAPREIGRFGTFIVYYDQQAADNACFMTYRGSEWYDASMYMGVFLPFVPTDAIEINVRVRQAFVSMEAYKFQKPNCVVKFTVAYES